MDKKNFNSALQRAMGEHGEVAEQLLDAFATLLKEECSAANRVAIPGFGTFGGVKHDEEIVDDLTTGKRMLLPPSIEIEFVAGSMLKKRVKEGAR